MKVRRVTPILNVIDVPASIAWFESLGWQRGFTWNDGGGIAHAADSNASGPANFGSVCSDECEIFLCKDGQGARGNNAGAWMSWWVDSPDEVDAVFAAASRLGYDTLQAPRDEPWGVREFHLRHPDGHTFRVGAGLEEHD